MNTMRVAFFILLLAFAALAVAFFDLRMAMREREEGVWVLRPAPPPPIVYPATPQPRWRGPLSDPNPPPVEPVTCVAEGCWGTFIGHPPLPGPRDAEHPAGTPLPTQPSPAGAPPAGTRGR